MTRTQQSSTHTDINTYRAPFCFIYSAPLYLGLWAAAHASENTGTVVYSNDFSQSAGPEWTDPTIATANGESFLGGSEYGFGNGSNTLNLENLPDHTEVTVSFDLYIINSWDGNGSPDSWQLTADGNNLLSTTFGNNTSSDQTQTYPEQLPPYGAGGLFSATYRRL